MSSTETSILSYVGRLFGGVIFFAIGGYLLYLGGEAYVKQAQIQQFLLPSIMGGAFCLIGGYQFVRAFWTNTSEAPSSPPEDAPWKVRPAWQTNELTEDTSLNWNKVTFAVLWNLFTWPLAGLLIYNASQSAPGTNTLWLSLFLLLFPAFGIYLGWAAFKQVLHRRKFGASTLIMETMPARLGRRLQARLRTKVLPDEAPSEGFHVRLSCYHRYIRVTNDPDGGRDRTVAKNLKWRDEKHVRGRTYADQEWGTEVPISFELPADPPPSTPQKKEERIMWELDVSADIEGLDYEVSFELPVFEPDETSPSRAETMQDEGSDASEDDVYWDMGETDPAEGGLQREKTAEPTADPYAKHEVGDDFTEPVSDGIHMEGRPGHGLTFSFAPARSTGQAIFLSILGVGLFTGGVFAISEVVILGLVLLLFGGLISYGAWQKWTDSSTVTIDNGRIEVRTGSLFKGAPKTLPCSELEDVRVDAEGQGASTTYYTLRLVPESPEAHADGTKAKKVLEWAQGNGQGDPEQSEEVKSKFQDVLEKEATTIRVASDLSNKQEADWIAEQILEAAEREASFQ